MMTTTDTLNSLPGAGTLRTVAVVARHTDLRVLDAAVDAGDYDVVFIESLDHAYSHIKEVAPHLIVLCLDVDEADGFQVLSMLKLDEATARIPIVTSLTSSGASGPEADSYDSDRVDSRQPVATSMN